MDTYRKNQKLKKEILRYLGKDIVMDVKTFLGGVIVVYQDEQGYLITHYFKPDYDNGDFNSPWETASPMPWSSETVLHSIEP